MHQAERRKVYLSPHFDDIAFSLGAWVSHHPGGTLVNIFTRSAYLAHGPRIRTPTSADVERISALRDAEDKAFCDMVGLERVCLDAEEPSLRGRHSRDATGVEDDVAQIRDSLTNVLDRASAEGGFRLFCPAAIGGHVNHIATRDVVVEWMQRRGSDVEVAFYEDLPYAQKIAVRQRGIRRLKAMVRTKLRRLAWHSTNKKMDLVGCYPSQYRLTRRSIYELSPAALWPLRPHEAVWVVAEPAGQGLTMNSRGLP